MEPAAERGAWRKIFGGLIPWDVDAFMATHDFDARLRKTPKDDWDHRPQAVAWDVSEAPPGFDEIVQDALRGLTNVGLMDVSKQPDGTILTTMNSLATENQVAKFIRDRYDDRYVGTAHVVRYFEIGYFIKTHKRRLLKEGLIRETQTADDPALGSCEEINEVVLKALCELPYTGRRRQGPSGTSRTFKLAAVLKRAKELLAEEGQ